MTHNKSVYNWDPSQGDFDRSQVDRDYNALRRKMNRDRILRTVSVLFSLALVTILIIYFAK